MLRRSVPPAERLRGLLAPTATHDALARVEPAAALAPRPPDARPRWPVLDVAEPDASVASVLRAGLYDPSRRGAMALVGIAVVAALVTGVVLLRGRPSEQPLAAPAVVGESAAGGAQLVVDVEGKVRHPGLVHVPDGARVDDALRAAGGVLPGASTAGLNLAQKVTDGQQLLVGLAPVGAGGGAGASAGGLLDINLATVDDFDGLPGIGPVLAQRIVDWRTEHGRFASVDQLQEVSGIGASKYATLKSKVRV